MRQGRIRTQYAYFGSTFQLGRQRIPHYRNRKKEFGDDIAQLIRGLIKSNSLYAKQAAVESENFRKLLLSFAEDIRVIIIMIADRLCVNENDKPPPQRKIPL